MRWQSSCANLLPQLRPSRQPNIHLHLLAPSSKAGCKSTSRPKNFFLCYFSPPVGRDLFRWVTFRWLPFRYRSPFRRVALPTGRPPDGSPPLRSQHCPSFGREVCGGNRNAGIAAQPSRTGAAVATVWSTCVTNSQLRNRQICCCCQELYTLTDYRSLVYTI